MPISSKHLASRKALHISVLAKWKPDSLYYKASLLKCERNKKRCLIKYEDGLEEWADNKDLHTQLDELDDKDDIICCVCDDGDSAVGNDIIICEVCLQGYHQNCHEPVIDVAELVEDEEWTCLTCNYILTQNQDKSKKKMMMQASRIRLPKAPKMVSDPEPEKEKEKEKSGPKSKTNDTKNDNKNEGSSNNNHNNNNTVTTSTIPADPNAGHEATVVIKKSSQPIAPDHATTKSSQSRPETADFVEAITPKADEKQSGSQSKPSKGSRVPRKAPKKPKDGNLPQPA